MRSVRQICSEVRSRVIGRPVVIEDMVDPDMLDVMKAINKAKTDAVMRFVYECVQEIRQQECDIKKLKEMVDFINKDVCGETKNCSSKIEP